MADEIIRISEFCEREKLKLSQARHVVRCNKSIKRKVAGIREPFVNITKWEKIKATA